jgi:ribose-phosphate pyrophosphokinase
VGKDDPIMIVRCQSGLPTVGEVLELFASPHYVSGWMRGSHNGPLIPCALDDDDSARFDGPPRVVGMGFQLADGRLIRPRDVLGEVAFDRAAAASARDGRISGAQRPVRAGTTADGGHGVHDHAAGRRADARALGTDRGTGASKRLSGGWMAVHLGDPHAQPRRRARAGTAARRSEAVASLVVVLPGCGRFASGLPRESLAHVVVKRFANGELHVEVPDRVRHRLCVIIGSISPPAENLARVTLVAHALRRAGAARITAVLPYLAYARQDRAPDNESRGLAWVGGLLRASGILEVVCVDVHSEQATALLGRRLISLSPAHLLASALPESWRLDVTLVSPDEGAIERASAIADTFRVDRPVAWARKRRTAAGVEHLGLVGRPGRRAIVVDDILDTVDTLVSCCRRLRDAGARRSV